MLFSTKVFFTFSMSSYKNLIDIPQLAVISLGVGNVVALTEASPNNLSNLIAKYNTEIVLGYTQHYKNKFIREHAFYFISYYHGSLFNICTYWITNGKQESIETLFKIIKEFEKIKFIQKAI